MKIEGEFALQGELLASSQSKVVELHTALTQHAHRAGVTDEQLLIENARVTTELESSRQRCHEFEGWVTPTHLPAHASHAAALAFSVT